MHNARLTGLLAGTLLTVGLLAAPPAPAAAPPAPLKPCGTFTLRATHAASADFFDDNGDRWECWATPPPTDPLAEYARDNRRLPLSTGYKFYAWGDSEQTDTGVTAVHPRRNRFRAVVRTQEDDQDMNGCFGVCVERLRYDRNDLFFLDLGNGSRKVRLARFEANLRGAELFTMIYRPARRQLSIFSLELG